MSASSGVQTELSWWIRRVLQGPAPWTMSVWSIGPAVGVDKWLDAFTNIFDLEHSVSCYKADDNPPASTWHGCVCRFVAAPSHMVELLSTAHAVI